jgi:ATP-binding cassette subfamily B protein
MYGGAMRSFTRDRAMNDKKIAPGTIRRIIKFAKPYSRQLLIFLALVIVDSVIGAANPLIYREIIDQGILGSRADIVINLALLVAGLAVIDAALSLGERFFSSKIGEGLIYDMRTRVFAHIQQMPLAFFTRTQTGALVSRLDNDVRGAQEAFTDVLSSVVGNLISVGLVLIAMLFLSWQLTLISLILLPVFIFPARWLGRKLQSITRESYDLAAQMNNIMIERFNVAGALLSKLFGRPAEENELFRKRAGRVRDIAVLQAIYARFFFIALMLTAALATALVYGWGGVLAVQHILDVGTVVALTAYLARLYGPLTSLSNVNVDIMTMLVSFERVFEVLDLTPMIVEKRDAKPLPAGPKRIEFNHVRFHYPSAKEVSLASLESVANLSTAREKDVLEDINFTVEPGQLVALVGPSGSGKTTITNLVPRLYDVRGGSVKINGLDIRDTTFASLHGSIGIVTQDAHMFHTTIRENLLYANPLASEKQLINALESAQILPLIEALPQGLDTMVGDRGYRLSGGEKQRLAIARLLLKTPDIVILDEATAHLDSESEQAIQRALQIALAGRTSLVIAHRLSTIRNADQILVLNHGTIVERGRHEELLASGKLYADLYRRQFSQKKADAVASENRG